MARFSITEAALEGFRVTREHPGAVALWAALQVAFTVGAGVILLRMPEVGQLNVIMTSTLAGQPADAALVRGLAGKLMPVILALGLAGLALDAVLRAGLYRIILGKGGGYLRLGADEFRLVAVALATGLLAAIPVFIGAMFLTMLAAVAGPAGAAVGMLAYLASLGVMVTIYVRLSLAGPLTLAEGRIRVLSAASLARGHAWSLFGTYVLAFILYLLVAILVSVVENGVRGALGIKEVAGVISAATIAGLVVQGLVAGLGVAIIYAPAAKAYRQITGEPHQVDAF